MSKAPAAQRYWHTLRHLKPVQVYGRLWHRLHRPAVDTGPAPDVRPAQGGWAAPAARPASMLDANTFRFLNVKGPVESRADWNDPGRAKLWLYNLHYFDDLNAADADTRGNWHGALIDRWIAENPPGLGNGWEPYPLSLRIVNWIKWALSGNELRSEWRHSLAVQARHLARRLEWHLLGNHLFANAKALVFAGAFFHGPEADRWLDKGLSILDRELDEQVLGDGGHFELSPMYHAIILEDVLDLINLAGAFPDLLPGRHLASLRSKADAMRAWLAAMTHPDGGISFFNDAAFGIAASPDTIDAYARRLGLGDVPAPRDGLTHLADSGYVRVQRDRLVALLDVARIGPDYLPGHAHADTLSFELSLDGRRVFVNSGVSQYGVGPQRQSQRATAAHNTVEVDGENSSEVWGGFRVARRARPFDLRIDEGREIAIGCAHDGYGRLPGRPVHRRQWRFGDRALSIRDRIDGRFGRARARLHLHPDVGCALGEDRAGRLSIGDGGEMTFLIADATVRLAPARWHPEFGLSVGTSCLDVTFDGAGGAIELSW